MTPRERTAAGLFLGIYGALAVPFVAWPMTDLALDLLTYGLYCLLALGLAAEVTELLLAFCWRPVAVPRSVEAAPRDKAAVLMTVCDDWTAGDLLQLLPLAESGYRVFLLDDSLSPARLPEQLSGFVTQVRRGSRAGAKAGNLNHWLRTHGHSYEYVILLDSDSAMSVAAADALVGSAEHAANAGVALFQAKVEPPPSHGSLFARILAAGARPRTRILERVHSRLGLLLSFGHNQLLRVAAVRSVGGFNETYTSEDTVLSLDLAAAGWRSALVDAWSWDRDPSTIAAFNRRTLRWARQTVELFHGHWGGAPLRLKLLLCRHLLMYTLPVLGTLLLGISLWTGPSRVDDVWGFMLEALRFQPGFALYGLALWPVLVISASSLVLGVILARREGVPWKTLLLSKVLGSAPYALLVLPLAGALIASAMGHRVQFVPTSSRFACRSEASLRRRLAQALPFAALSSIVAAGALSHPGSLLVGFNLLWLSALLGSPIGLMILAAADRRRRSSRDQEPAG